MRQRCSSRLFSSRKARKVFDRTKQTSIGFEKCVNLATQHAELTEEEAGLLRTVGALRDGEQHWLIVVPEDVLYLHARGFITTFDDLLKRTMDDTLAQLSSARLGQGRPDRVAVRRPGFGSSRPWQRDLDRRRRELDLV